MSSTKVSFTKKVLVVGNGIASWAIAVRLAERGVPVVLLDADCAVCATLKNEGWLHQGTYHSCSQATDLEAKEVAERTQRGAAAILADFPEAVEQMGNFSIALVHEDLDLAKVQHRWALTGVQAALLDPKNAPAFLPEISVKSAQALFIVKDQPINTARLLALHRRKFVQLGGKIVRGVATRTDGLDVEIRKPDGALRKVTPRLTVWSAGFAGVEHVRDLLDAQGLKPRFWRSNLLITSPLVRRSWFELQDNGVGLMNHLTHVVIGLNNDVKDLSRYANIADTETRNATFDAESKELFDKGLRRHGLPPVDEMPGAAITSCTKVDLVAKDSSGRDLKPSTVFVSPTMLIAFPGKMTEAPVLADEVVTLILDAFDQSSYPLRDGDVWSFAQVLRQGGSGEKAELTIGRDTVTKTHATSDRAMAEAVVKNEVDTKTGIPTAPSQSRTGNSVNMMRLPHGTQDTSDAALAARASNLAEFHHLFRFGQSAVTMYRDAAATNGFTSSGIAFEIDWSSSNQLRHPLDDVALLTESLHLEPEDDRLLTSYLLSLEGRSETPVNDLIDRLVSVGLTFTVALDSVYKTYARVIADTTETVEWKRADALTGLAGISFHELRPADITWFRAFRKARLRQHPQIDFSSSMLIGADLVPNPITTGKEL